MKHFYHTIRHASSARPEKPAVRNGFTLTEMMVSIGLVLLIMAMFASIFSVVADTMSAQKGIAKNDQKARTLTIIMKEDLEHRTFRRVVPFFPGQKTIAGAHGSHYKPQDRQGYFSISENDPDDPTDDVLAFTARFDVPVSGKATILELLLDNSNNLQNQNQPEFDDGFPPEIIKGNQVANGVGVSKTVEIVYFLRNGNLYRRVMLVREPYDDEDTGSVQPVGPTTNYISGDYVSEDSDNDGVLDNNEDTNNNGVLNSMFWRDFDYSAYRNEITFTGITVGPKFHGSDSMNNDSEIIGEVYVDANGVGGVNSADVLVPRSLGVPFLRFGHSPALKFGTPREFVIFIDPNGKSFPAFIGRFLQQETAHSDFGIPGIDPQSGNPFNRTDLTYNDSTGKVEQFEKEIFRRGEDILMSNVHEFDIKVWDDYTEDFNRNGQLDDIQNVPGVLDLVEDRKNTNNLIDEVLRFVDLGYGDLDIETPDDTIYTRNPVGYYHWSEVINEDFSPINILDTTSTNTDPPRIRYDTWHPYDDTPTDNTDDPPFGFPPFRPLHPFDGNDRVPGTFQDDDRDGVLNDDALPDTPKIPAPGPGERGWLGSDDEVPLKAIQITVRFFDVESDQMRQLTLTYSLTD
jgi:prepilin-type N-terminal cleavage/methylation domain-containing protein